MNPIDKTHTSHNSSNEESLGTPTHPYTTHTTHTTLHKKKRKPIQIRMRECIHEAVGRYIGNYMTYGRFYEEAAILFMDTNPSLNGSPINLIQEAPRDQCFDDELQEMIVVDGLEELLSKLRRLTGDRIHVARKKDFLKIVKEYQKVKAPSNDLQDTMLEAKTYFD